MKAKAPARRRKFASTWDQIGHLYDKLLYWLYDREKASKALVYADRLARILNKADPDQEAIFGQECRSLIHESRGDLHQAIKHRENEIRLIRRLREISRHTPHRDLVLETYSYGDLSDRLDLLAMLYHDCGNLEKAVRILQESKQLCKKHGIKFDGDDLMEQYLDENRSLKMNSRRGSAASPKRSAS